MVEAVKKESLADWIFQQMAFVESYRTLQLAALRSQFLANFIPANNDKPLAIDWDYLLQAAAILAGAENVEYNTAALEIASYCISAHESGEVEKVRAGLVLDALNNRPTINLAYKRNLIPQRVENYLRDGAKIQWVRNSIANRVIRFDGQAIFTNKFQKKLWEAATENEWVSVSAPTSAGKSFIISQWIIEQLLSGTHKNIVYLVPTRALITQVINDIKVAGEGVEKLNVSGVPTKQSFNPEKYNVLVFTQERLHIFLS